jgi:hypothetical protein
MYCTGIWNLRQNGCAGEDVKTTMIYTHVLNRGGLAVRSPLDGGAKPRLMEPNRHGGNHQPESIDNSVCLCYGVTRCATSHATG